MAPCVIADRWLRSEVEAGCLAVSTVGKGGTPSHFFASAHSKAVKVFSFGSDGSTGVSLRLSASADSKKLNFSTGRNGKRLPLHSKYGRLVVPAVEED